ncbi:MAG TPA: hypothetical protein VEB23_01960 [Ramlibacter sp.]|nr:hypothetical protein [Ramlibacter sp.]
MPTSALRFTRPLLLAMLLAAAAVHAQDATLASAAASSTAAREAPSRHLAPGFSKRAADSRLLVLPADMELFSISAGGVVEPRDDWTEAAQKNFAAGLATQRARLGSQVTELNGVQAEEFAEITALHRAVADAIQLHHRGGWMELPTKNRALDWSLGEAVRPLRERTGADYALFTWVRDSYASSERKLAMVALAALGAISLGGEQNGYASLVDLRTGRIVWFNQLSRMSGDLREPAPAVETVEALLKGFPALE